MVAVTFTIINNGGCVCLGCGGASCAFWVVVMVVVIFGGKYVTDGGGSERPEEVKRQYRKLSLLVHPDKCKHAQANEAFSALAKAQQLLLLDPQEREYLLSQVNAAKEELRAKWKKQLKKDNASNKIKSQQVTEQEWGRRKMQMRISEEEEGRLKKDEEETKEMWKRKREHEEQWEGTREQRVSSWRDFMKTGKKTKKREIQSPKLKTEDPNKSYVQRPVKRG
ncbi:DnaJ domain [Macleaya cordata]|uniref:DnaJ domain n=1 Tax=Macleaya cordata TaxID=56857 RepID=A0A200Q5H4_MACCD|nr:DnaJ domain [Macleaya cordata]